MVCAAWLGAVGILGKLLKQYEDDKARATAKSESASGSLSSASPSSTLPSSEQATSLGSEDGLRESTTAGPSSCHQREGNRIPGDLNTGQTPATAGMTRYWDAAAAASGDGADDTGDDMKGQTTYLVVVVVGGHQPGVVRRKPASLRGNGDSGLLRC